MFEKIIKYFSIISIGVFILSYAFLDGYYSFYNIRIINYITPSEVFYVLLAFVVGIMSGGMGLIQGYNVERPNQQVVNDITDKGIAIFDKKWFRIFFPLFIGLLGFTGILVNSRHFNYRNAPGFNTFFLLLLIVGISYTTVKKDIQRSGVTLYMQIILFLVIGFCFRDYGAGLARINSTIGNSTNIGFRYHNKQYRTGTQMIFAGETQSTLFVYYKKDSSTWVVPRSAVDSLVVYNK